MSKKILIIAYEFPPYHSIAAHRPYAWYQYLPEFEWHPVVITRCWDEGIRDAVDYVRPSVTQEVQVLEEEQRTLIRVPHQPNLRDKLLIRYGINRMRLIRKVLTAWHSVFDYTVPVFDDKYGLYIAAEKYLRYHKVDLMLATGYPFISYKYLYLLYKKYNIPYVVDYRDGWTTDEASLPKAPLLQYYRLLERRWTRDAALRTYASQQYKKRIERELFAGKGYCHYNGYFEEDVPEQPEYQPQPDVLRLGYAGTLYPHQPLEELAGALSRTAGQYPQLKVELTFYGAAFYPEQEQRIARAFANSAVSWRATPRYDHPRVMRELAGEDVLVLLSNPGIPQLYAKVFDYIALNKVVLHYQGDTGDLQQILDDAGCARQAGNPQELEATIQRLAEDKLANRLRLDSTHSSRYSRREQVRLLAAALDEHIPVRS